VIKIKAYPNALIERLVNIQMRLDKEIEREIQKAKRTS